MEIHNTSLVWKINFFLQLFGLLLIVIGYSTKYIGKFDDYAHVGLWEACDVLNSCYDFEVTSFKNEPHLISTAWAKAARTLLGICMTGQSLVILLTLSALVIKTDKFVAWCTAGLVFFSVLVGLIGIAVAVGEIRRLFKPRYHFDYNVGWSFGLIITSLVIFAVAGILGAVEARRPAS
ncbi:uncharacterized protein LOC131929594 [Physella acuta]|uniref:uncharacterized protein LOC131929594 n=1 Tax=Physella acuta TaxID=109671 RepID=UPI0027DAF02E|nr:uncharacterized protein LOC131929594 [Physella acuta]XP_059141865.1 uncharacterized protein LOC131929594 [Physella acuta]XP_059141866.1 uncharacterized protein LOC131929594 [Physella acuta]